MTVYPDYYENFRCIAGACRHSCCIGWEIDIDAESLARYETLEGDFGDRVRRNISYDGVPHFVLPEDERCPFLRKDGLCDMIIELGEDSLCGICADHPRFRNELPDRVEMGLGFCCEEAARVILRQESLFSLINAADTEDEIILMRDEMLRMLWDTSLSPDEALRQLGDMIGAAEPSGDMAFWAEQLLELEILENTWRERLRELVENPFEPCFGSREMRNFICYLIYRHIANSPDIESLRARFSFIWLSAKLMAALGGAEKARQGELTFDAMAELARQFSAEIEYSEDNLFAIIDAFMQ